MPSNVMTRAYTGRPKRARMAFAADAKKLGKRGWMPVAERYDQPSWGCFAFLIALLLCLTVIGILVFIYLIIVKPTGTLHVTYQRQATSRRDTKVCPDCAEAVAAKAKVCRYCGNQF